MEENPKKHEEVQYDPDYVYTYDMEEIDECIEKLERGIIPAMYVDQFAQDVNHRIAELKHACKEEGFDESQFNMSQAKVLSKKIEQNRRKASRKDVIVIQLTDEQKEQLHKDMACSYVRHNHNLRYHKSDEELFDSTERRDIYRKLTRLQKQYYNAPEWIAAMKIIIEALDFSLHHDYPWMSYEEAVELWNKGEITFTFCPVPLLMTSWTTSITDTSILKGILTGEITMQSVNENNHKMAEAKRRRQQMDRKPVYCDYTITSTDDFNQMRSMHNKGYNTPISPVIKALNGSFSRFALPGDNYFTVAKQQEEMNRPTTFDWMQDNAGEIYYKMITGKKDTVNDLLDFLREKNNNLNPSFANTITPFLNSMSETPGSNQNQSVFMLDGYSSDMEILNKRELEIEKSIMDQMTIVSP